MTLPGQTITRRDGGLGISAPLSTKFLFVGCSVGGAQTANTIATYSRSQAARTGAGQGLAIEAMCRVLDIVGGSADFLKVSGSVAASNSAITKVASHAGPTITVAGSATLPFDIILTTVTTGALGVGTFKYSLDGGKTYSENLTIPSGGTLLFPSTGLTFTFPAGTYTAGESYTLTATPATYNSSDLTTAWAAAIASTNEWPVVVFCGEAASGSAAATIAGTVATLMANLAATFRYAVAVMHTGNDTPANCVSAFAAVESPWLCLTGARARFTLGAGFAGYSTPRLPFLIPFVSRLAQVKPSTNPGWRGYAGGALEGVFDPSHNEEKDGEVFHPAKINAPTTQPGSAAIWPTNGLLKSSASSDFKYVQWARVINIFCTVVHRQQQPFVNGQPPTKAGGKIEDGYADGIRDRVKNALRVALLEPITDEGFKGFVSDLDYDVDRENDILTSGTLQSTGNAVPHANIEQITTDIGFAREIAA